MYRCEIFDINDSLACDFYSFKQQLYSKHVLRPDLIVNKYVTKLFVVYSHEKPVSRASAILNPEISYQGRSCGLIGHFESNEDTKAAGYLFDYITEYFRDQGLNYLIGPMNGSTWHSYRVAEPSENGPLFLDVVNKPYYSWLFNENDFEVIARYCTTCGVVVSPDPQKYSKHQDHFSTKGISIRSFEPNNFNQELKILYRLSLECFKENFLYTGISFADFQALYKDIKGLITPEYCLIAENKEKQPLGFIFCFDNPYEKGLKSLIIKTLGRKKVPEARGLGRHLADTIYIRAQRNGYDRIYHALMHEQNVSRNILSECQQIYRKYALFAKEII